LLKVTTDVGSSGYSEFVVIQTGLQMVLEDSEVICFRIS